MGPLMEAGLLYLSRHAAQHFPHPIALLSHDLVKAASEGALF